MVQTYQEQVQSRAAKQQDLRVNADPDAFGASVGKAVQGLGAAFADAGQAMAFKKQLQDQNDSRSAEIAFNEERRNIMYDPNTGYLNQTGANAAGNRDTYEDRLEEARDRHAATLSPAARREFQNATDSLVESTKTSFIQHDASQLRETTNTTGKATVETYMSEAMLNYGNPQEFDANLGRAVAELDRLNKLNGITGAAFMAARNDLVSGARTGVIGRLADSGPGGPTKALAYMEANKDDLTATDLRTVEVALKPMVLQDRANNWVNERSTETTSAAYDRASASQEAADSHGRAVDSLILGPRRVTNVEYGNQGATRNQKATAGLEVRLGTAAENVYGPGTRVVIYSGGQAEKGSGGPRTGSTRHDSGKAADVHIFGSDGKQIKGDALGRIAQYWLAKGYGGAGLEMHGGGIHLDEHADRPPTWDYANEGGSITAAQQEAVAAGLRGELPGGATQDRMVLDHLGRTFGPNVGPAVLSANPSASMTSILGVEEAQKLGVAGMTAGQYVRKVQIAMGAPDAPQAAGSSRDWAGDYAAVAELRRTDPELADTVEKRLDADRLTFEKSQTAGQQQTFDELWNRGVTDGNWQLSTDERLSLGSSLSAALDNAGQNFKTGIQYTDPVTLGDLTEKATKDPEGFSKLDLADLLNDGLISANDYQTQRAIQVEIGKATSPEGMQAAAVKALGGVDPAAIWRDSSATYGAIMGYDPTPSDPGNMDKEQREQVERFKQALLRQTTDYIKASPTGAAPSALEMQQMVYAMLEPVQIDEGGLFGSASTAPRFDVNNLIKPGAVQREVPVAITQIPADIRTTLGSIVPGENGVERTGQVEKLYNDFMTVAKGGLPEVTIDDVDPAILDTADSGGLLSGRGVMFADERSKYKITFDDGEIAEVDTAQLLEYTAIERRNRLLDLMKTAGLSPERLRRERQPVALQ